MKSFRVNVNGESLLFNEGEKYSAILKRDYINEKIPITLAKQRNKYYEFTDLINNDGGGTYKYKWSTWKNSL